MQAVGELLNTGAGLMMLASTSIGGCPIHPMDIRVEFEQHPPVYSQNLETYSKKIDNSYRSRREEWAVEGEHRASFSYTFNYELESAASPENPAHFCVLVQGLNVKFTSKPSIRLASHLEPGSCRYNVVLQHEERHAAIDREFIEDYKPTFIRALQTALHNYGAIGPFPLSEGEEAVKRANRQLKEAVKNHLAGRQSGMEAKRNERHRRELDNRANYLRESKLCPQE